MSEGKRKEGNKSLGTKRTQIAFVKSGEKSQKREKETGSYFDGATDWKMQVDFDKKLKVPAEMARTNLGPDLILVSNSTKRMGVMELTVPN